MSDRSYCSEESAQGDERLAGTADQVDLWVLLEAPGGWSARPLEDETLHANIRQWCKNSVDELTRAGIKARVQLIKQRKPSTARRLFVATTYNSPPRMFCFQHLMTEDGLIQLDLTTVARHPEEFASNHVPGSMALICTNGLRDQCCARFGKPLYIRMAAEFGDMVWQTTHLGGHRFAPNLLVLPEGLLYGRVSASRATAILTAHAAGCMTLDHLRGRSCYTPEEQVAELYVRMQSGDLRCGAYHIDRDNSNVPNRYRLRITRHDGRISVVGVERVIGVRSVRANCADAGTKAVDEYRLVEILE